MRCVHASQTALAAETPPPLTPPSTTTAFPQPIPGDRRGGPRNVWAGLVDCSLGSRHVPVVTGELDSKVADDLKAVAAFPGEVPSWLYNRAERLGLPRYRIGQQYRYRLSEVAQWVERSREDASL